MNKPLYYWRTCEDCGNILVIDKEEVDKKIEELEAKIKMLEGALNMSNVYPKDNV